MTKPTDTQPQVTQAEGYAEAETMLREILDPTRISDTAIRVARDHMLQFMRAHRQQSENALRSALEAVKQEGLRNHNTRCRSWWPLVCAALDGRAEG